MSMMLSADQGKAVKAIRDWFGWDGSKQVFHLQGYAGVGETTTVRFAIDDLGLDQQQVCYAAYTMKAAAVMQKSGLSDASTNHATITEPDRRQWNSQVFYVGHFLNHVHFDRDRESRDHDAKNGCLEIDWGWAITCHKSQGSGWPHVAVIFDHWGKSGEDRVRWLYTAITRAAERLTILE